MSSIVSSVSARAHHRGRSSGDLGRARTSVCITQSRSIPTTSLQPVLHDRRLANSATANCAPQSACPWTRPAHPARPARSRFNTHSAPPSARAVQSNGIFCLPDPDQRPHGKAAFARRVGQAKDSLLYEKLFITARSGRWSRAVSWHFTPSISERGRPQGGLLCQGFCRPRSTRIVRPGKTGAPGRLSACPARFVGQRRGTLLIGSGT